MKPLIASQRMLTLFCVLPADKTTSPEKKILYNIFFLSVFFGNFCALFSSSFFFVEYVSLDLEESLYSLFQIVGSASIIYLLTVTYFLSRKIRILFEDLSEIYKKCKEIKNIIFCIFVQWYNISRILRRIKRAGLGKSILDQAQNYEIIFQMKMIPRFDI